MFLNAHHFGFISHRSAVIPLQIMIRKVIQAMRRLGSPKHGYAVRLNGVNVCHSRFRDAIIERDASTE